MKWFNTGVSTSEYDEIHSDEELHFIKSYKRIISKYIHFYVTCFILVNVRVVCEWVK